MLGNSFRVCVAVLSGSEEAEIGVCARGGWTVHRRGVHHCSDLSLPDGFALGVGLHPGVNTAYQHVWETQMCLPFHLSLGATARFLASEGDETLIWMTRIVSVCLLNKQHPLTLTSLSLTHFLLQCLFFCAYLLVKNACVDE